LTVAVQQPPARFLGWNQVQAIVAEIIVPVIVNERRVAGARIRPVESEAADSAVVFQRAELRAAQSQVIEVQVPAGSLGPVEAGRFEDIPAGANDLPKDPITLKLNVP